MFSSPVNLSHAWSGDVPTDVTTSLTSPVTPPSDGQINATPTVSSGGSATAGDHTLRIAGSSNGLSDQLDVAVTIAETTPTPSPSPSPSPTPSCIIATAAYSNPPAPEVTHMRHVRDDMIGSTKIGQLLVGGWNVFYYSWSRPNCQVHRQIGHIEAHLQGSTATSTWRSVHCNPAIQQFDVAEP